MPLPLNHPSLGKKNSWAKAFVEVKILLAVMAEVQIINSEFDNCLAVDPYKNNAAVLKEKNDNDRYQKWNQINKRANGYFFRNVGSGGYLCVDPSPNKQNMVKAATNSQTNWIVAKKDGKKTIRLQSDDYKFIASVSGQSLGRVQLRASVDDDEKFLWQIIDVSD